MDILEECDPGFLDLISSVELSDSTLVLMGQDPGYNEDHTLLVFKKKGKAAQFGGFIKQASAGLSLSSDGAAAIVITPIFSFRFDPNKTLANDEDTLLDPHSFTESSRTQGSILRHVQSIANSTYCVDNMGGIFQLDEPNNKWLRIFPGDLKSADGGQPMFNAITGFASDDLYAVGFGGQIWHFDGQSWSQKSSPTTYILTNATVMKDLVVICGVGGVLVQGRDDSFEALKEGDNPSGSLFGLAALGDIALLANEAGMTYYVKPGSITIAEDLLPSNYFTKGPSGLWATSSHLIRLFDGEKTDLIYEKTE